MWVPNLGDVGWMSEVVSRHAARLEISGAVGEVRLLDARLTHPHHPESPLCAGWATYVVTTDETSSVQLYIQGFSGDDASEAAWRAQRAARRDGSATHLAELDLIVWRFPGDPRLTALPTLVDPRLVDDILPPAVREVLDLRPGEHLRTTMVRYQPEASATLRLDADGDHARTVFAKHLPDAEVVVAVAERHQRLWSMKHPRELRLAQPLAVDSDRGVLWTRGVPGGALSTVVTPAQLPEVTTSVGALLAALHASSVEVTQRLTADQLLAEAAKKAHKLARAHPPVARGVADLVATATAHGAQVRRERSCTLHGDFHLDQLVSSPDGPVLVDLDSMIRGAPEIDLAEFLVDLSLRGLPGAVAHDVSERLLTSYTASAESDIDLALLALCADAEFVNRCYRHLRRHAFGWEAALEAELGRHADLASLIRM